MAPYNVYSRYFFLDECLSRHSENVFKLLINVDLKTYTCEINYTKILLRRLTEISSISIGIPGFLDFLHRPILYKEYNISESDSVSDMLYSLDTGRWTKSKTPVIQSVIHHRQNPLGSNHTISVRKTT
jgi:hypothetical protein